MAGIHIRQLVPGEAEAFQALRLHGLRECPEAFGSTYSEEETLSLDVIAQRLTPARRPVGRATFGAFVNEVLVGIASCTQETRAKSRHKAIVWGMYVLPEHRRRGLARRLLEAVILEVRSWQDVESLTLTVVERAAAARQLYRAMGFAPFGREPDGLRQDGIRDTVEYLVLSLRDPIVQEDI